MSSDPPTEAMRRSIALLPPPIPLVPSNNVVSATGTEVTLKFRRIPTQRNSDTYQKKVHEFAGDSTEGYVKWRQLIKECQTQMPLTTVEQRLNQAGHLLASPAKDNFNAVRATIIATPADYTEENFTRIMDDFAKTFLPADAALKQQLYLEHGAFQPETGMTVAEFSNRLKVLNSAISYLPGQGTPLNPERMKINFVHKVDSFYISNKDAVPDSCAPSKL